MTLMLGQQGESNCDPCCNCGAFCTSGYCGHSMEFVLTHSGASNGATCTNCADMNTAVSTLKDGINPYYTGAALWNGGFKPPGQAFDAKSGTNVCFWTEAYPESGLYAGCYSGAFVTGIKVAAYFGTDDKWHMTYIATYHETGNGNNYQSTLSGDAEFAASGTPMDCGTPGEATPTFSLTISLSEYDVTGGPQDCIPPTSVLVEGNPQ